MSDKAELVMRSTADLRRLSKVWRKELLADGEQRSRCWTLSALNDALCADECKSVHCSGQLVTSL